MLHMISNLLYKHCCHRRNHILYLEAGLKTNRAFHVALLCSRLFLQIWTEKLQFITKSNVSSIFESTKNYVKQCMDKDRGKQTVYIKLSF